MKNKFEDSTLITAYIKETLHNFNLPMMDVYTKDTIPYEGKVYIKNNKIVKYENGDYKFLAEFVYNKPYLNRTTKFIINSSTYDEYTHEYFGKYLRFIRDYKGFNLMPLYNCFGGKQPSKLVRTIKINDDFKLSINTYDSSYNYYLVPVKFNKEYTVAIDAPISYEMMCIINTNNFLDEPTNTKVESDYDKLVRLTYKNIKGSTFGSPFIYSTKTEMAKTLWPVEKSLYLLLKLPAVIDSTITILEGNFAGFDTIDNALVTNTIVDQKECYNNDDFKEMYPTKLSLLELNDTNSYPFADRLVEYLLGQAVSELDNNASNVLRTQLAIYGNDTFQGYAGIWSNILVQNIWNKVNSWDKTKGNKRLTNKIVSENGQEKTEYKKTRTFIDDYNDLLYRLDRDVESFLRVED